MFDSEPISTSAAASKPRHANQEIADLLGAALCRLLHRNAALLPSANKEPSAQVLLGFTPQQSVYDNASQPDGV
jgi:hypothetical protein